MANANRNTVASSHLRKAEDTSEMPILRFKGTTQSSEFVRGALACRRYLVGTMQGWDRNGKEPVPREQIYAQLKKGLDRTGDLRDGFMAAIADYIFQSGWGFRDMETWALFHPEGSFDAEDNHIFPRGTRFFAVGKSFGFVEPDHYAGMVTEDWLDGEHYCTWPARDILKRGKQISAEEFRARTGIVFGVGSEV